MTDFDSEYTSSEYMIAKEQDIIAQESLQRTLRAFNYVVQARDLRDRVVPADEFQACQGIFWLNDFGKAVGNFVLWGRNQALVMRSEHYISKAEDLIGGPIAELDERG